MLRMIFQERVSGRMQTFFDFFFKSEFGPGGIRTHNLLSCGQTPKPYCLGAQQEDSCLPKILI